LFSISSSKFQKTQCVAVGHFINARASLSAVPTHWVSLSLLSFTRGKQCAAINKRLVRSRSPQTDLVTPGVRVIAGTVCAYA